MALPQELRVVARTLIADFSGKEVGRSVGTSHSQEATASWALLLPDLATALTKS